MQVLALVPYPLGLAPGQRYRIEQWAPHLAAEGVHLTFDAFLTRAGLERLYRSGHLWAKTWAVTRGWGRRLRTLQQLERYQAVYVYREAAFLGTSWLERTIARTHPLVYDFDDAIYLPRASEANAWARPLKSPGKAVRISHVASRVVVATEILAAAARRWSSSVTVVPSTIDTDLYVVRPRTPNARPVLGWTGSLTTAPYLELLLPALRALRAQCDYRLRVVGARPALPGIDVEYVPWSAETEVDDLRSLDVGLMPMPDDAWARGKAGMKALQYMALGIPPVVSPVGANPDIVEDGVSGFHARSDDEWCGRLRELLASPDLRERLGHAARQVVVSRYSARVQAPRVAELFRGLAQREVPAGP
jgi:glycosyltransferase involved in cell wall biosynthesis